LTIVNACRSDFSHDLSVSGLFNAPESSHNSAGGERMKYLLFDALQARLR
jgi:hypothetical protein